MGDKCSAEFFKSMRQKNVQAMIIGLRDSYGRIFTERKELDKIFFDFYKNLYQHKEISEEALEEVLRGMPSIFTNAMNKSLAWDIMERKLTIVVNAMTKEKGHDGVSIEIFKRL